MENPIQQTELQEEEKESRWVYLAIIAIVLFLIFLIAWFIDLMAMNGRYYLHLVQKPACEYKLPPDYKLVTDGKMWAVKVGADHCLHEGKYGVTSTYTSITEPSLFFDTCQAKGYAKEYLEEMYGNKMKGFE